jgi:hypothetical protein
MQNGYCSFLLLKINFFLSPSLNPLMPELNPNDQRCLPEFFAGAFKF